MAHQLEGYLLTHAGSGAHPTPGTTVAKKTDAPIKEADLQEFLETQADFTFEMRVLKALRDLGFECEHGGTYRDPITEKVRQFDIRAQRDLGAFHIRLAVECKNLRPARPLLLHTVARRESEAYHEVIVRHEHEYAWPESRRITSFEAAYPPGEFVGKATDQVGRKADGTFLSSDEEVFEKITQAVNGARDLVDAAHSRAKPRNAHAVIPMLVVPDGTLWQVDYADDGAVAEGPKQVATATLFLKRVWGFERQLASPFSYSISHLEIVVLSALGARTGYLMGPKGVFAQQYALFQFGS